MNEAFKDAALIIGFSMLLSILLVATSLIRNSEPTYTGSVLTQFNVIHLRQTCENIIKCNEIHDCQDSLSYLEVGFEPDVFNSFKTTVLQKQKDTEDLIIKNISLIAVQGDGVLTKFLFAVKYNNGYGDIEKLIYLEQQNNLISKCGSF